LLGQRVVQAVQLLLQISVELNQATRLITLALVALVALQRLVQVA
jgi:hypothetical protein